MKEKRLSEIPTLMFLATSGGWRFHYNHYEESIEETKIFVADFVDVLKPEKNEIISAIVRKRYSSDEEYAIHRKFLASEPGAEDEFTEYNAYVNECKQIVKSLLV